MNSLEESLPSRKNESPLEKIANSLLTKESPLISSQTQPTQQQNLPSFDWKTILIILLIILMVLMYLGINFLNIFGNGLQSIVNITNPAISKIFAAFTFVFE